MGELGRLCGCGRPGLDRPYDIPVLALQFCHWLAMRRCRGRDLAIY
jgi:hypothetical protein